VARGAGLRRGRRGPRGRPAFGWASLTPAEQTPRAVSSSSPSCSSWTDRDRTRPFLFLHGGGVGTMVGFADLLAGVSPLEPL
jgi:hypothetical protein